MKTKSDKKMKSIKEVIKSAVTETANDVKMNEPVQESQKRKTVKMVVLHLDSSSFTASTPKAHLLSLTAADNSTAKVWLAKSLISVFNDADNIEKKFCRMPAWLYYRKNIDKLVTEVTWYSYTR